MKSFTFVVGDKHGIHARPAGVIVNCARKFSSEITVENGEKTADAKKLLAVMGLAAKCGDTLEFNISGEDEESAAKEMLDVCIEAAGEKN